MKTTGMLVTLALLLTQLGGCAINRSVEPSPEYAPVPPVTYPVRTNGSIYELGKDVSLVGDTRALRVGDLLTITLEEQTNASKQAGTNIDKNSKLDIPAPTIWNDTLGKWATDIESEREFEGTGSSKQSNSLTGRITVTVVDVQSNGNLIVRGEKLMRLNQGDEYIRISGIVRPVDIRPDNSVPSTLVANARISYGGTGAVADANSMGWLARFFNTVFYPF